MPVLERVSTAVVAGAALVVALIVVRREFTGDDRTSDERRFSEQQVGTMADIGRVIGDSTAPVKITVFSDMQCPFCSRFHRSALSLLKRRPRDVAVMFIHFPIATHKHARAAAIAADCAARQQPFTQFVNHVFDGQERVFAEGNLERGAFHPEALASGVKDLAAFSACQNEQEMGAAVDRSVAVGEALGVTGTPTIVVGDRVIKGAISEADLERVVERALRWRSMPQIVKRLPEWLLPR